MKKNYEEYNFFDFVKLVNQTGKTHQDPEHIPSMDEYKGLFNQLGENHLSFYFVFNFTTCQYPAYSKSLVNLFGYDLLGLGFEEALKYFHSTDRVLLKVIHTKLFEYYFNTPIAERGRLKFHFNYRMKKSDGSWITILQQSIITHVNEDGSPLYDFSICTDISSYKKDNNLILLIFKLDEQDLYKKVLDFEIGEEWIDEQYSLSNREVEILAFIANGKTTKEIAGLLFLSEHTINSHRKNILKKTDCKSFAEVIKKILVVA